VLVHAVALNPKNEDAYFKLAALYMMKGDADNGLLVLFKNNRTESQ
jgi:Flp pilus assembly protein TadD